MTSPHPQREEAARLWPEYNSAHSCPFFKARHLLIALAGYGAGTLLADIINIIRAFT